MKPLKERMKEAARGPLPDGSRFTGPMLTIDDATRIAEEYAREMACSAFWHFNDLCNQLDFDEWWNDQLWTNNPKS